MFSGQKTSMVVSQGNARAMPEVLASLGDRIVTVTQKEGESRSLLAQRARHAVEYLEAHGSRLTTAVFVARHGFDLEDVPATAQLVRGVVAHMVRAGQGAVHLQAADSDPRSRYALTALAETISEQVRGTGVTVLQSTPETSQTFVLAELEQQYKSA